MHILLKRLLGLASVALTLAACSGGDGGSKVDYSGGSSGQASTVFALGTQHDAGASISPPSVVVEAGKTASFTVQVQPGYVIKHVSGANGTLEGNIYTTAAISANDTIYVETDAISDQYAIVNMRMTPRAFFDDEFKTSPFTIEVTAAGKGFTLYASHFDHWFDGSQVPTVIEDQLYDDGTHGDKVANDGVYSRTLTTGMTPSLRFHDHSVDQLPYNIIARDAHGTLLDSRTPVIPTLELGVVGRQFAAPAQKVAEGLYAASHMVNVVMPTYRNKGDYMQAVSTVVYANYDDLFDIQGVFTLDNITYYNLPDHLSVKSQVQGINFPIIDNTAHYGSHGKLQQVIEFHSSIFAPMANHEIGHQWGFYLNKPQLMLTRDALSGADMAVHTGSPSSLLGQMGNGLFLEEQSNGDFKVAMAADGGDYHGRQYADLELYLMGLLPASGVSPLRVIPDPAVRPNFGEILPRNKTAVVTMDDIQRVYGRRTPDVNTSQKSFRALFIGLSETPMSAAEIAIINRSAQYYAGSGVGGIVDNSGAFPVRPPHSFYSATRGLATLVTAVPPKK
ncbi:MAG: choice-of-anchor X domain-containing protein [Massilia sp.]